MDEQNFVPASPSPQKSECENEEEAESASSASNSDESPVQDAVNFFTQGPEAGSANCWSEPSTEGLSLRGKSYMADGVKVEAESAAFKLLDGELFKTVDRDSGEEVRSWKASYAQHPMSFVQRRIQEGEAPFMAIVHIIYGACHLVSTWGVDEVALQSDTHFATLWNRFLTEDDDFRMSRLKIIPRVVEGAWVVRKGVGNRPALIATKMGHWFNITDRYIEIVLDTVTGPVSSYLAYLCTRFASTLSIDLAFLVEGRDESELPEKIWGIMRACKPDLENIQILQVEDKLHGQGAAPLPESPPCPTELQDLEQNNNDVYENGSSSNSPPLRSSSSESLYEDAQDPLEPLFELYS